MGALCKGFRTPQGPAPLRHEEPPQALPLSGARCGHHLVFPGMEYL